MARSCVRLPACGHSTFTADRIWLESGAEPCWEHSTRHTSSGCGSPLGGRLQHRQTPGARVCCAASSETGRAARPAAAAAHGVSWCWAPAGEDELPPLVTGRSAGQLHHQVLRVPPPVGAELRVLDLAASRHAGGVRQHEEGRAMVWSATGCCRSASAGKLITTFATPESRTRRAMQQRRSKITTIPDEV